MSEKNEKENDSNGSEEKGHDATVKKEKPTPPLPIMAFSNPVDTLLRSIDVRKIIGDGQILIEYSQTGATVEGSARGCDYAKEFISPTIEKGLKIDYNKAVGELFHCLVNMMGWNATKGKLFQYGLIPNSDDELDNFHENVGDILSEEDLKTLYERGFDVIERI